jgi:hypothetical protein
MATFDKPDEAVVRNTSTTRSSKFGSLVITTFPFSPSNPRPAISLSASKATCRPASAALGAEALPPAQRTAWRSVTFFLDVAILRRNPGLSLLGVVGCKVVTRGKAGDLCGCGEGATVDAWESIESLLVCLNPSLKESSTGRLLLGHLSEPEDDDGDIE